MMTSQRIAKLENMAEAKRIELELIEAELKKLRGNSNNNNDDGGFERYRAEVLDKMTVPEFPPVQKRKGGGIRLS